MSADKDGPRNWDKELADIDKIIAGTPPAKLTAGSPGGGGSAAPAKTAAPASRAVAPATRGAALATWIRVGLGVALAAGMTQWPYFHACGTALFLYLGAIGVLGVSGVWGALSSWRHQKGLAHTISLFVLLWAGILAAATILPRTGYATRAAVWWCP